MTGASCTLTNGKLIHENELESKTSLLAGWSETLNVTLLLSNDDLLIWEFTFISGRCNKEILNLNRLINISPAGFFGLVSAFKITPSLFSCVIPAADKLSLSC